MSRDIITDLRYIAEIQEDANSPTLRTAAREIERLRAWVDDLQSGMYINCVYCGHRYGPQEDIPAAMADVLKEHIEQCPKHPLSYAKAEIERLNTWSGLMSLLDKYYPADIFDGSSWDAGPRITVLVRQIDRLRTALREAAEMIEHEPNRTLIYNHCTESAEPEGGE